MTGKKFAWSKAKSSLFVDVLTVGLAGGHGASAIASRANLDRPLHWKRSLSSSVFFPLLGHYNGT